MRFTGPPIVSVRRLAVVLGSGTRRAYASSPRPHWPSPVYRELRGGGPRARGSRGHSYLRKVTSNLMAPLSPKLFRGRTSIINSSLPRTIWDRGLRFTPQFLTSPATLCGRNACFSVSVGCTPFISLGQSGDRSRRLAQRRIIRDNRAN